MSISQVTIDLIQPYCLDFYNCELILTQLNLPTDEIRIVHLKSLEPNSGNGTKTLCWLISMLPKYQIKKIHLQASPLGGMSKEERDAGCSRLVKFYRKLGFKVVGFSEQGGFVANVDMELEL